MENILQVSKFDDRLEQIRSVAMSNNCISYWVLVDLLKDKNSDITVDDIEYVVSRMQSEGFQVLMSEEDEGYNEQRNSGDSQKYIPAEVNITPRNITVDAIVDRLRYKEINLDPDFQRRGGLWSVEQQSQLIESLMLRIPLPTFYFDASKEDEWVVIDGLQRLTAFKNFMIDKSFKLRGLEYLVEFEGYAFDELPRQYYRRIKETQITVYTVEKGTPDDIVFNIFKRINTGGLILSPQEIRHALYQGPVTDLINRMIQEKCFKDVIPEKVIADERMLDREYATRFIAFTELDYHQDYQGNIDSFLTKALKQVNNYQNDAEYERILKRFVRVMKYCYEIFGKYAFRRVNSEYRRGPINKAIFELWTICFKDISDEKMTVLVRRKEIVLQRFIELLSDKEFATSIKAGDKYSLEIRVSRTKRMLEEIFKTGN